MEYCATGGLIGGKPKVKGDSPKNDTVDIKASPGEMIIPITVVEKGPDAIKEFAIKAMSSDVAKKNYSSGGKVQDKSLWDKLKDSFEEDAPKTKTPVKDLDPDKAKALSSVFNTDKFNKGGVVSWDATPPTQQELAQLSNQPSWDSTPPTKEELAAISGKPEESILDKPVLGGTVRGYTKGLLNTLPTAGMLAGGAVGGAAAGGLSAGVAGPVGAVTGAGLGSMAGESLKKLGEKYILGEEYPDREKFYGDIGKSALEGAAGEMGGQVIGKLGKIAAESKVGKKVGEVAGNVGAKVGEMFTGVPEQEIKTYAKNAEKISEMAKSSDNNVAEAADQLRTKFAKDIANAKMGINSQLDPVLKQSGKMVEAKPVLDALNEAKSAIDADFYPEQIKQVNSLIDSIKRKVDDGMMTAYDANLTKRFLQDKASSAYRNPGDIFSVGTEAANAAKAGAAKLRVLVNDAVPEVAALNNRLADLHRIDDMMNANLISAGKPEAGLLSAGSGGNLRNAKALSQLGDFTGTDMLGDAQNLAAMRTFGSPKLMAADTTGKAVGRMGLAGGLGFLAGGPAGAVGAAGITSPAALRTAIDTGRLTKEMLKNREVQTMLGKGLLNKAEELLNKKEK